MAVPKEPITLSVAQIEHLQSKLGILRHNVNNHLALILAATEIVRRKPESVDRLLNSICGPQEKIGLEVNAFSAELERMLGITRD
jgi:hypothetical protein